MSVNVFRVFYFVYVVFGNTGLYVAVPSVNRLSTLSVLDGKFRSDMDLLYLPDCPASKIVQRYDKKLIYETPVHFF